MGEEGGRMDIC